MDLAPLRLLITASCFTNLARFPRLVIILQPRKWTVQGQLPFNIVCIHISWTLLYSLNPLLITETISPACLWFLAADLVVSALG